MCGRDVEAEAGGASGGEAFLESLELFDGLQVIEPF